MSNIIELARQAGFAQGKFGTETLIVRHTNGSWIDVTESVKHLDQLIRADEREKSKVKSFAETYSYNPHHTCKCEHWEACDDCHPGCESVIRAREKRE